MQPRTVQFLGASLFCVSLLAAGPLASGAKAAAVSSFTATDGYSTVPTAKGSTLIDTRLNVLALSPSTLAPTLNLLYGLTDSLELGLGTFLTMPGGATSTLDLAYPWLRGSLPALSGEGAKLGYMLGADIPARAGSPIETATGASLLADFPVGSLTYTLNAGYKRYWSSGANQLSCNANVTWPMGAWTLYGEAFANARLNGTQDGGLRASIAYALAPNILLDFSPAVLFAPTPQFNPNIGVMITL